MDDAVVRAMGKWPNVPSVYGWLQLDRRGTWLIKGERIANRSVTEFIGRNYEPDDRGRWYFQNGPQRVFVALGYTPYVVSILGESTSLGTHTAAPIDRVSGAWVDETGTLILRWSNGIGVVNDRDLAVVSGRFTDLHGRCATEELLSRAFDPESRRHATGVYFDYADNRVPIGRIRAGEVPQKFGFDPDPRPAPGEPEC